MSIKDGKLVWVIALVLIVGLVVALLYSNNRLHRVECERDVYSDRLDEANSAIEETASQINEVQIAGGYNELKTAVDGLHQPENVGVSLASCSGI